MYNIDDLIEKTPNPHLYLSKTDGSAAITNIFLYLLKQYLITHNLDKVDILDIGGGKGWGEVIYGNKNVNYYCLDLKETNRNDKIHYIKGDITDLELNIDMKFDIIFSKDTYEHILNPWDSSNNLKQLLKNNGLIMFFTPFSWRYHASPYDTYRYTHTGLQYIIERLGCIKKITSGYINYGSINGSWKNSKDHTCNGKPFQNCLESFYIGIKDETHIFNKEELDSDFSWSHET